MHMSFLAILLAAIASMIIGSIWYGPLFGKIFMREMGMEGWSSEKKAAMKKSMTVTYIWQFVASLVMFFCPRWIYGCISKSNSYEWYSYCIFSHGLVLLFHLSSVMHCGAAK